MTCKILINAVDTEECRIAKVRDSKLEEFHIESASLEITHGNIYKGIITRIEPSLQAVFVDYGGERHGFLQKHEIHSDYFQDNPTAGHTISQLVKKGQELLVQVTKDPIMKKGAMLTTNLSLPGRYIVLMPGSTTRGISRKISDEKERARLKEIISKLTLPEGFGLIIRTAGIGCTKTLISKDSSQLMRLWKGIKSQVMEVPSPALLYKERNLVVRSIRDYFTPEVTEILIDDSDVHREAQDFVGIISPKHAKIVKFYKGEKPIFSKFQLEDQIASIYGSRVDLKSGGSIVIEQSEALVAVDVNSGKATKAKSIEETALRTNVEAAEEIARQLRLRDMGGLIVIDFIDMRDSKNKSEVERTLKTHVKGDKARTRIGRISQFGLLEMSRQRIRPSIEYGRFETCSHCNGRGLVLSAEALGTGFLRQLSLEMLKPDIKSARGVVPVSVADYVLNKKRKELLDLEQRRNVAILIEGDAKMVPGESQIICEK
ncbi:Rne/Rng family ribonuclease [Desulfosarcina sp.]|uniref:Rne/Rng family ribonuclease n=1 Tax=Desulfosarcina sp. TaxID=2027861 RepID=UPI0029AC059C|nr:Rne/Rng family ribonuclease [Desulfosarcina sp.]MDX2454416.1 Rne/Rng family ribonuclease [Desulfosarcina sp.]